MRVRLFFLRTENAFYLNGDNTSQCTQWKKMAQLKQFMKWKQMRFFFYVFQDRKPLFRIKRSLTVNDLFLFLCEITIFNECIWSSLYCFIMTLIIVRSNWPPTNALICQSLQESVLRWVLLPHHKLCNRSKYAYRRVFFSFWAFCSLSFYCTHTHVHTESPTFAE